MRELFLSLGLTAAALVLAEPSAAEVVFQGSIVITAVTAGCNDFQEDWRGTSIYHPNISGNPNFSAISIVFDYSASSYGKNGGFTSAFQNVNTAGVGSGPYTWAGSQVLVSFKQPATISTATRYANLRGKIKKPENDSGGAACIATFEASYVRKPGS